MYWDFNGSMSSFLNNLWGPVARICNKYNGPFLKFEYIVPISKISPQNYAVCHDGVEIREVNYGIFIFCCVKRSVSVLSM
jgi:hypothetical protein